MPIFQLPIRILAIVSACLVTACASTVNVDYNKNYNFNSIRTIQIVSSTQPTSSDTRINSSLVSARIKNAIVAQLNMRGYQVVETSADIALRYQLSTRSGVDSYGSGISFGLGHFGRHTGVGIGYELPGYDVDSYDESVLTIDILEGSSNKLLWRGSDSRRLTDGQTPESLDRTVNKLVSETLANFPPGRK